MRKLFLFIAAVMCAASMSFAQEADTREVINSCLLTNFKRSYFVAGYQNPVTMAGYALLVDDETVWFKAGYALHLWNEDQETWEYVDNSEILTEGQYGFQIELMISGDYATQYRFAKDNGEGEEDVVVIVDGRNWEVTSCVNYDDRCILYAMSPKFTVDNVMGSWLTFYEYNPNDENCTTNAYIPFYGFYSEAYLRAQYVMPATELEPLRNRKILKLQYALANNATNWNSTVQIFLKEVDYTTIDAFDDLEGAQMVYEGSLSCDDLGTMSITLDNPYTYHGGNLLIAFDNVEKGDYISSSYYGREATGASISDYSYGSLADVNSPTQRNFIPQTTFVCDFPAVAEDGWVYYDDGINTDAIGVGSGDAFSWGIKIPAGTVTDTYLTKVSQYVSVAADATVSIYQGGPTPLEATLLHTQDVTFTQTGVIEVFNLIPSVQIDPSKDIWIVFNSPGYAASYSTIDNVADARWLEYEGVWHDLANLTFGSYIDIAWMIRGLFASEPEDHPHVSNIQASDITSNSANLAWEGLGEAYDLRYKKHNPIINNTFQDDDLGDWTTIDADGDGYTWVCKSFNYGDGVGSASYMNGGIGSLDPDNYLVSPKFVIGDSITFEAMGIDRNDFQEHFGVAVSTTSNTDPTAFTTIWEETLDEDAKQTWKKYTVDLSTYKGQEGYVAIRHFDCTNQYWILVRNVTFYPNQDPEPDPEWTVVRNLNEAAYALSQLEPYSEYWVEVKAFYGEEISDWSKTCKFRTLEEGTGIEEIVESRESRVESQKILHEGHLYILRDGKIFNAQGARVK